MTSTNGPSIYYSSDKNIFDALINRRISSKQIRKLLRERGILVSSDMSKYELAKYASSLVHDYHDNQFLSTLFENPGKREKTTSGNIDQNFSNEEIHNACETLKDSRMDTGESYKISTSKSKTEIVVQYTEVDYSKTELRQRVLKKCTIEIQREGENLTIRRPANSKAAEVANQLLKSMSLIKNETIEEKVITLEAFQNPESRSFFFHELINNLDGLKLEDVTQVCVDHEIDKGLDIDCDEEIEITDNIAGYIRKAALNGESVLESTEFKQLHSSGFFISKIVWTALDQTQSGDKYEFEAEFGDPRRCTDFKYLARGIYNKRQGGFNIGKRSPSAIEKNTLNKIIEAASNQSFQAVINKFGT